MHWPQDSRDEARGERSVRGAVKRTERTDEKMPGEEESENAWQGKRERGSRVSRRSERDRKTKERGRAANRERERRQRRVAVRGGDYRAVNHPR